MMLPVKLMQRHANSPTRGHVVQFIREQYDNRPVAVVLLPNGKFGVFKLYEITFDDEA